MQPAGSNYLKGAVFGFAAASIWASWGVITRLGVTVSLVIYRGEPDEIVSMEVIDAGT